MQQNNLLIFVYGTLRRDCPTGANRQYLKNAEFISLATTRGSLYLIDYYPGLCVSDNVETWVAGEIYLLNDEQELRQLDGYEGCTSDSPQPHEYTRALIDVILANGETQEVWSYLYNGNTATVKYLASGDFLTP